MSCLSVVQGEFAQIIHLGGEKLVQSCLHEDGTCDMVRNSTRSVNGCNTSMHAKVETNNLFFKWH